MTLPTDQEIMAAAEREPAKVGMLATAAILGGFAIGVGLMESVRRGWMDAPEAPPPPASLGAAFAEWGVANFGLVLCGAALGETIDEMGRDEFLKTVGLFSGAIVVMKLVADGVRKARGR